MTVAVGLLFMSGRPGIVAVLAKSQQHQGGDVPE